MGGHRTPQRAAALLAAVIALSACRSPAPFYRTGHGSPDAPVVGLGGAAPYVRTPSPTPLAPAGDSPAVPSPSATHPPVDVYSAAGPGMLAPAARGLPARLYVPNIQGKAGIVDVIDQRTMRRLGRLKVGKAPQWIVPSWDFRTLWAADPSLQAAAPVSPHAVTRGRGVALTDPGALYYTPDGTSALVMAPGLGRIDARDPRTMRMIGSIELPCHGAAHADFTADGKALVASCPSTGWLVRVDPAVRTVTGTLRLPAGSKPGDLRLSPDGRTFYVADTARGGVWLVDAYDLQRGGFIPTGAGAHGLVLTRDSRRLLAVGEGSIAVIDLAARQVTARWPLSAPGPLAVGGLNADGTALWLSDTGSGWLYQLATRNGKVLHKVKVGGHPHAVCVYPQPGRHSLGGPGLYR
ncbi:YncE family protein [Actinomadura barringtoniae]